MLDMPEGVSLPSFPHVAVDLITGITSHHKLHLSYANKKIAALCVQNAGNCVIHSPDIS